MDKLLQMMGLARRANLLLAGEEVVADAIAAHKARLVLLAADASERTGKKTRQMAGENTHHILEAVFKGAGRALKMAVAPDEKHRDEIPSTMGVL